MKKSLVLLLVVVIAALSVMAVSADQMGGKHWCNSDSYGCWVTGDDGEQIYIMFWSESARDYIMGPGSNAPLGINPGSAKFTMPAPMIKVTKVTNEEGGKPEDPNNPDEPTNPDNPDNPGDQTNPDNPDNPGSVDNESGQMFP